MKDEWMGGEGRRDRKGSFSHSWSRDDGASKTIVASTSTFHGSSGWSVEEEEVSEIRTEG